MSSIITVENFGVSNLKQQSYIEGDVEAGAEIVPAKSALGAAISSFLLVGSQATETAEIRRITAVTGDQITVTPALSHPHAHYTNICVLYCNQIRIYRAPNVDGTEPADAAFTVVEAVNIEPDHADTDYIDVIGSSEYWYKFTYFNSFTLAETNRATSQAVRGGGLTDYCTISDIKDEAGIPSTNAHISDSMVARRRMEAQAEIDSTLSGKFPAPFSAPIPLLVDVIATKLAAGFLLMKRFGTMTALNTNNGDTKVKEARALLQQVYTGQKALVDAAGNDLKKSTGLGFSMYPNENTAAEGGGERFFRMTDVQGYESRRY